MWKRTNDGFGSFSASKFCYEFLFDKSQSVAETKMYFNEKEESWET